MAIHRKEWTRSVPEGARECGCWLAGNLRGPGPRRGRARRCVLRDRQHGINVVDDLRRITAFVQRSQSQVPRSVGHIDTACRRTAAGCLMTRALVASTECATVGVSAGLVGAAGALVATYPAWSFRWPVWRRHGVNGVRVLARTGRLLNPAWIIVRTLYLADPREHGPPVRHRGADVRPRSLRPVRSSSWQRSRGHVLDRLCC